jgi:DNA invertase Pin-like site-specific DNA recombinase
MPIAVTLIGMRIVSYTRVSTDKQAEHGLGLNIQRDAIRAWAKAGGHKVVASLSDSGISGSNGLDTRLGLAEAFRLLEAGKADAVVVYRLDRLARKLANQLVWIEQLEAKGKQVISVTEPDVGQDEMRTLVRQVLGAISEYERATIVRRMQGGRAAKAADGGYAYGSPAFGHRAVDGQLVADDREAAIAAEIREMRAAGKSLRQIADHLNTEGHAPKRGGVWHPVTVSRVLAR